MIITFPYIFCSSFVFIHTQTHTRIQRNNAHIQVDTLPTVDSQREMLTVIHLCMCLAKAIDTYTLFTPEWRWLININDVHIEFAFTSWKSIFWPSMFVVFWSSSVPILFPSSSHLSMLHDFYRLLFLLISPSMKIWMCGCVYNNNNIPILTLYKNKFNVVGVTSML